ncbi:MAG: hypothetical protein AAFR61_11350 [Bacteroidota bacterium]
MRKLLFCLASSLIIFSTPVLAQEYFGGQNLGRHNFGATFGFGKKPTVGFSYTYRLFNVGGVGQPLDWQLNMKSHLDFKRFEVAAGAIYTRRTNSNLGISAGAQAYITGASKEEGFDARTGVDVSLYPGYLSPKLTLAPKLAYRYQFTQWDDQDLDESLQEPTLEELPNGLKYDYNSFQNPGLEIGAHVGLAPSNNFPSLLQLNLDTGILHYPRPTEEELEKEKEDQGLLIRASIRASLSF